MASAGVFALLQAVALLNYMRGFLSKSDFKIFFLTAGVVAAGLVLLVVVGATMAGVVAPWSGRFYSLWDTGYAKIHIPIIASVSEHQPTTWFSFFFDLHILACIAFSKLFSIYLKEDEGPKDEDPETNEKNG